MVNQEQQERKLEDYVDIFIRRKWPILIAAFFVFILFVLNSLSKDPVYKAGTVISIQSGGVSMSDSLGSRGLGFTGEQLESHIAIIKSLPVAERIVEELKLNNVNYIQSGRSAWMKISDRVRRMLGLEVPYTTVELGKFALPSGRDYGTLLIRFLPENRFRIKEPESGDTIEAGLNELVNINGYRISVVDAYGPEGTVFRFGRMPTKPIANDLRKRLKVRIVGSGMLEVGIEDSKPERAYNILTALASVYADEEIDYKTHNMKKKISYLEALQERVLQDMKGDSDTSIEDIQIDMLYRHLEAMEKWLSETQGRKYEASFHLDYLQGINGEELDSALYFLNISENLKEDYVGLKKSIDKLEKKRGELLQKVTGNHPEVSEIGRQIAALKGRIQEKRDELIHTLRKQVAFMDRLIEQNDKILLYNRKALFNDPKKFKKMQERKAKEENFKSLYNNIANTMVKLKVEMATIVSDVRVIEPAQIPSNPIRPDRRKELTFGAFVALLTGAGCGLLLERFDQTVKSIVELEQKAGLPVFGSIPLIFPKDEQEHQLVTVTSPKSAVSEAYRSMRTNIQFANLDKTIQTLLLTSGTPFEGKTVTTSNLAVTLADTGLKTLIIDCDMRRPTIHKYFNLKRDMGLSDVLSGRVKDYHTAIFDTSISNLSALPAGTIPPNPSELLGSEAMNSLLKEVKQEYQMILLDVPPVLVVTDAVLLGPKVDGLFMIARANHVRIDTLNRAVTQLETANIKPLGTILNGYKAAGIGYGKYGRYKNYKYNGYYARYGHYYDYRYEEPSQDERPA